MKNEKQSLKERLLQQYADQLDALFEQLDPRGELDLTEIEDAALALRQQTGEDVTQALTDTQAKPTQPDEMCPHCGQKMRYKGKKPKQLSTRSGEVEVNRPYYYCETCHEGIFPLDERWQLDRSRFSQALSRELVWFGGLLPFETASMAAFHRVYGSANHVMGTGKTPWRTVARLRGTTTRASEY